MHVQPCIHRKVPSCDWKPRLTTVYSLCMNLESFTTHKFSHYAGTIFTNLAHFITCEQSPCIATTVQVWSSHIQAFFFADSIFRCIVLIENWCILIPISLKFVLKGPNTDKPSVVQLMARHQEGDKQYLNQWWSSLLMHICIFWPWQVSKNTSTSSLTWHSLHKVMHVDPVVKDHWAVSRAFH